MEEEAKAVQEVAKVARTAIDAGREASGFFARYLAGPLEEISGIITDELKFRRSKRVIRLEERAREFLAARGLDGPTRTVPLAFAIPLLQAGTLEEDDDLQDLWAALLANSADASSGAEPRTAFISILKSLSKLDARVLSQFQNHRAIRLRVLLSRFTSDERHVLVSLHNLSRLGCLSTPLTDHAIVAAIRGVSHAARGSIREQADPNHLGVSWATSEFRDELRALDHASDQLKTVYRTELGEELLRACSPPTAPEKTQERL